MKNIKVGTVVYEMLQELSKRKRVKPETLAESLIKEECKRTLRLENGKSERLSSCAMIRLSMQIL